MGKNIILLLKDFDAEFIYYDITMCLSGFTFKKVNAVTLNIKTEAY